MKHSYFLFLLVTSLGFAQLTPPPELQDYYSSVDFNLSGTQLYDDLAVETIAKHTSLLAYSERHDYLYDADEDLSNSANVILMYSGESRSDNEWLSGNNPNETQSFNTEHVYPQSLIGNTAKGDLHHLRSCDIDINTDRGNNPFAAGSGSYADLGAAWYPGDEWKGDVARMVMYLNLRYAEPFEDVGNLALFLQWNVDDPVSPFEENRNSVISGAQGVRNPFIDNPYIATVIWGGPTAPNSWNTLSVSDLDRETIKVFPNPVSGNKIYFEYGKSIEIKIYDVLGKLVLKSSVSNTMNNVDISSLQKGVYILKMKSDLGTTTKKLIRQ